MARVLVTGGTGFVAGWCIVDLLAAGHEVVTTVRSPEREPEVRTAVAAQGDMASRLEFVTADLTNDDGWGDAMAGCEHVLHVASPLSADGTDADALISAAREGTTRVIAAAQRAGVARVVLTSSCAAATPTMTQLSGTVDETCWTDADEPGLGAYRRSKTLAERAAWDLVARSSTELTTVLPAAVFGPALSATALSSLRIIAALLDGSAAAIPRLGFEVVDVRDVAAAHLLAMTSPQAAGERFIVSGALLWFDDVAEILRARLGPDASRVPSVTLTDDDFRAFAAVSPELATLLPLLGRDLQHSSRKAERVLGWRSRPASETVVDSARCLLAFDASG